MVDNSPNKRLAKNTIALYFRTIIVTLISLVISRELLSSLGVEEYGIYNVVGSVIVFFAFINTAITQANQRFISFELGKLDGNLKRVISTAITTQIFTAIAIAIILEIGGVWVLNHILNIPEGMNGVANVVLQFSILNFCILIIRTPYDSVVIAHEKMTFFAYVSILDILLKLLIVYLIKLTSEYRLQLYVILLCVESALMLVIHIYYCIKITSKSRYEFIWDKKLIKAMLTFSGWTLFGSIASVGSQQGVSILVNIFYGVAMNASLGISSQVNAAVSSFVASFQTSFRPQIIKSYASGDIDHTNILITQTSKFSFALMFLPTLLLIVNMPLILSIWLSEIPPYSVQFCRLILICTIIDAFTGPYNCAIIASGKIKYYQISLCFSAALDIIVSYLILRSGASPYWVLLSRISTRGLINMFIGLFFMKKELNFNISNYCKNAVFPVLSTTLIIVPILFILESLYSRYVLLTISSIYMLTIGLIVIYMILMRKEERLFMKKMILNIVKMKKT